MYILLRRLPSRLAGWLAGCQGVYVVVHQSRTVVKNFNAALLTSANLWELYIRPTWITTKIITTCWVKDQKINLGPFSFYSQCWWPKHNSYKLIPSCLLCLGMYTVPTLHCIMCKGMGPARPHSASPLQITNVIFLPEASQLLVQLTLKSFPQLRKRLQQHFFTTRTYAAHLLV